jgi:alpha-beta hydrolase superfamily lysophospholipase
MERFGNEKCVLIEACLVASCAGFPLSLMTTSFAAESTMPASYVDAVKPELAAKYTYTENGEYSKALNIPTYEWMPAASPPKVIVLGVHGLTLHGRRFRVLARTLAVNGVGFVAMDMRGFGACRFDEQKQFSSKTDDKTKVDHEKRYEDIVKLAKLVKEKYPDVRLVALGESLGCTFCVRLAAEYPDLIFGVMLSAPAVRISRSMYAGRGQIKHGVKAVVSLRNELDLRSFFTELCSQREDVQKEIRDDPLRSGASKQVLIWWYLFCRAATMDVSRLNM